MKKRFLCIVLCILLCFGMVGCKKKNNTRLVVGISGSVGYIYPFSEGSAGDKIIKDMIFTKLLDFDTSGLPFCGSESSSVSESFRIYHTDTNFSETESFTDGGYTAFEFTLKNGICFSNGEALTSEDVLFSLYCALDPAAGYIDGEKLPAMGLDNYIHQSADASDYLNIAGAIASKGRSYVPTADDSFSESESAVYWSAFDKAGMAFTSNIVSHVTENYCSDELVSSYIFDGYTGEQVKNNEALRNTYAMKLWKYGNFVYSYVPDENGIFVGTEDTEGGYVYKTTLEKALESDEYTTYIEDENGSYVFDRTAAKYRLFEEDDTDKRYSRVLSEKYVVLSKSKLTGFRDAAGTFYSLEDDDFPSISDFFSLMCISYTDDGVFDYQQMETIEAAYEGDGFAKSAASEFASTCTAGQAVTSIEGIKHFASDESGKEKIIIYIEKNLWDAVYYLDIPVVSKKHYTDGFSYDGAAVVNFGVPLGSESFAEHMRGKAFDPVGAGAYTLEQSGEGGTVLSVNERFNSVSSEHISPVRYGFIDFVDVGGREAAAVNGGEVDICLADVANISEESLSEGIVSYFVPDFSYDYVLVNPAHYININTRRAILSVMDTSLVTSGDARRVLSCSMPSFMWAYDSEAVLDSFDESGESAKAYFEAAGYAYNESGELIDPATKRKASFTMTILPSADGTAVESMFDKAAKILNTLGADATVVFDGDLLYNVHSENGVGIYSLGWETEMGGSLYMRYAYTAASAAVRANGISLLPDGGQLDNFGILKFTDGEGNIIEYNQSEAVMLLDELIKEGNGKTDIESKKADYGKALALIRELSFELPVCQRGTVCLVNSFKVDVSTLNDKPTVFASVINKPWKISPAPVYD